MRYNNHIKSPEIRIYRANTALRWQKVATKIFHIDIFYDPDRYERSKMIIYRFLCRGFGRVIEIFQLKYYHINMCSCHSKLNWCSCSGRSPNIWQSRCYLIEFHIFPLARLRLFSDSHVLVFWILISKLVEFILHFFSSFVLIMIGIDKKFFFGIE